MTEAQKTDLRELLDQMIRAWFEDSLETILEEHAAFFNTEKEDELDGFREAMMRVYKIARPAIIEECALEAETSQVFHAGGGSFDGCREQIAQAREDIAAAIRKRAEKP